MSRSIYIEYKMAGFVTDFILYQSLSSIEYFAVANVLCWSRRNILSDTSNRERYAPNSVTRRVGRTDRIK